MIVALGLLLVSLGFVLYRDRDFWFPDTSEADNRPQQTAPTVQIAVPSPQSPAAPSHRKTSKPQVARRVEALAQTAGDSVPPTTIVRTTLPPLEVEVVAGSTRKTLHPGSSSVHVDMEPATPSGPVEAPTDVPTDDARDTTANVTTNAAERTEISADTAGLVTRSVQPDYPMLARQMKVQGSVILQALIARDGQIQQLRVITGPPILATAAQEAVRQWHFKPHYEGAYAVETQAKITVNFTISTN